MSYWGHLSQRLNELGECDLKRLGLKRLSNNSYQYKAAHLLVHGGDLYIYVYKNENLTGDRIEVYGDKWEYPEDELGNEDHSYNPHRYNDWLEYGQWRMPIEALFKNIEDTLKKIDKEARELKEAEEEKKRENRRNYLSGFESSWK
jgi:hypothetical protein